MNLFNKNVFSTLKVVQEKSIQSNVSRFTRRQDLPSGKTNHAVNLVKTYGYFNFLTIKYNKYCHEVNHHNYPKNLQKSGRVAQVVCN